MINNGILMDKMVEAGYFRDIEDYGKNQFMVTCPIHNGGMESTPSMGINLDKGAYNCFGCGEHGTIKELAERFLEEHIVVEAMYSNRRDVAISVPKPRKYYNEVMYEMCDYDKDLIHANGLCYLEDRRGIDSSKLWQFKIGADGENIYFFTRNLSGDCTNYKSRGMYAKKFRNVKGAEKNDVLYGMYEFFMYAKTTVVVLCESEIDALSCWSIGIPALAIGGVAFTEDHVKVLKFLGIRTVLLAMDNDEAGIEATEEIKLTFRNTCDTILVRQVNHVGTDYKDLNDLLKQGRLSKFFNYNMPISLREEK